MMLSYIQRLLKKLGDSTIFDLIIREAASRFGFGGTIPSSLSSDVMGFSTGGGLMKWLPWLPWLPWLAAGIAALFLLSYCNKASGVSPKMALRLSKALGRSAESWLTMQDNYDLWQAKQTLDLANVSKIEFKYA